MLSCKEASRLCSEALDRPLGLRERLTLRMHLMMCSGCTNYDRQMAYLRAIARRYSQGEVIGRPPSAADDGVPPV